MLLCSVISAAKALHLVNLIWSQYCLSVNVFRVQHFCLKAHIKVSHSDFGVMGSGGRGKLAKTLLCKAVSF